jgi:ADP-heptose:LPS heptosyltransferase
VPLSDDLNANNHDFYNREQVRSVFILRPDHLGDAVLFSGTLRHLRAFYHQAEITLCVKNAVRNYFEKCPHVDNIISWEGIAEPFPKWLPAFRGRGILELYFWWFFSSWRLKRQFRYDLFLLPVRSPDYKMHAVSRAISAKMKYGISGDLSNQTKREDIKASNLYTNRMSLPEGRLSEHELDTNCKFIKYLGMALTAEDIWPEVWNDIKDKKWAEKNIVPINKTLIVALCPGVTSDHKKFYPAHLYAEAFSKFNCNKMHVFVFGSKAEKEQCEEVANAIAECGNVVRVDNLAGSSTVRQLIEGLGACDLVIANETAALHIAVALHKPTIGIMGGGHFRRFYPWGDPAINKIVYYPMDCFGCNWQCQYTVMKCIQEIDPKTISKKFEEIIRLMNK